jgi:16S rRNA (cytosine1402-N4)-methyltransferase
VLKVGGVAAVISFHSLEDRKVKQAFRSWSEAPQLPRGLPVLPEALGPPPAFRLLTPKSVVACDEEVERNPRARSARLRAVERLR